MSTPLQQMQTLLAQLGYPSVGTTNVPAIQWTITGIVVPPESAVLVGVLLDMNQAFGGNINPAYDTPQGQWATSQAAAISNCYALISQVLNNMDPDQNSGFMQDTIGRLFFQNRTAGTPTLVQCNCVGLNNTFIPAGALAGPDAAGNFYSCVNGGTIPVDGTVSLTFQNTVNGPIACGAGAVNAIYQAIPGWESITNPSAGILGSYTQSTESFEYQREESIQSNSQGSTGAVRGGILGLPGVTDCYVYENNTNSAVIVGSTNFSVPANAIFAAVIGGTGSAIAQIILTKKSPGCPMAGNTTITVTDPAYAGLPYAPTYPIKYNNNAENTAAYNIIVNLKNSSTYPSTIQADVANAVAAQFVGQYIPPGFTTQNNPNPNNTPVRIASEIFATQFNYAIQTCEGPQIPVSIISTYIGSGFTGTGTVASGSDVLTIDTSVSGSLSPGTIVTDADNYIPANTQIVQQLTGTAGGVGTYQMSANATNTSGSAEAITGSGTALTAQVGIDQAPTLGTVTVNLL